MMKVRRMHSRQCFCFLLFCVFISKSIVRDILETSTHLLQPLMANCLSSDVFDGNAVKGMPHGFDGKHIGSAEGPLLAFRQILNIEPSVVSAVRLQMSNYAVAPRSLSKYFI